MDLEKRHSIKGRTATIEGTWDLSWVSEAFLLSDVPMEDTLAGGYLNRKVVSQSTFYFCTARLLRSPIQH